jgi:hypothetical protein
MNPERNVNIGLIFTLDYEIHGNGSGEFENWAHFPTAKMLDLFDTYGAKLTIMAEMGHYWAMKRYEELFRTDILLFESQLKDAVRRGHDVQFHFHPQWIDARYEEGSWNLEFSKKTVNRLCYDYGEAYYYLKKGKEELENLLKPVNPDYQCVCFRAGFLQMQPSENMVKALVDAGYLSDSSVSKGMKVADSLRSVDFTEAYSKFRPWKISASDICKIDEKGKIFEFPLLSDDKSLAGKILSKIKKRIKGKNIKDVISDFMSVYGKGMMQVNSKGSFSGRLKNIMKKSWYYADFCQNDHSDLTEYIKMVVSECRKDQYYNFVPVVLIGHSKDFFFSNNLSIFLKSCKRIKGLEFSNFSNGVEKLISEADDKSFEVN